MKTTPIKHRAFVKQQMLEWTSWLATQIELFRKGYKRNHGRNCSHQFAGDAIRKMVASGGKPNLSQPS